MEFSSAKIQLLSLKKLKHEESLTGIIKARSSIKRTSVFIDIIVEKRMLVTKLFFVGLNVLPVRLVTKHVTTSKKNVAIVWIEHLMFVMGVIRKSITVRFAHKYNYNAKVADRIYRDTLSDSRAGICMTKHELHQKDQIITP